MTIPKVKCEECGYEGDYNGEIYGGLCQDCGQGRMCPKCKSSQITRMPSSTLPIDDRTGTFIGTKIRVDEKTMATHKNIRFVCNDCVYEW